MTAPKPKRPRPKTSETYKCERCGKLFRDEQLLTHRCTAPKEEKQL